MLRDWDREKLERNTNKSSGHTVKCGIVLLFVTSPQAVSSGWVGWFLFLCCTFLPISIVHCTRSSFALHRSGMVQRIFWSLPSDWFSHPTTQMRPSPNRDGKDVPEGRTMVTERGSIFPVFPFTFLPIVLAVLMSMWRQHYLACATFYHALQTMVNDHQAEPILLCSCIRSDEGPAFSCFYDGWVES